MTKWSMGPRVLKKSIIIIPLKCWTIFLTMKSKKRSLGGRSHLDAKKMGFVKNGYVMKMQKTQGSKEILIEMDKGRLRSLEKWFLWKEMVRWRRKSRGRRRWIVLMKDEKLMKMKQKRKKWTNKEEFWPPPLKLSQSWVNSVKSSWLGQPKKKNIFQSFQVSFKLQIFNSKFSIPNFQFHIINAQILNSNLQFSKNSNLRFYDQNFKS